MAIWRIIKQVHTDFLNHGNESPWNKGINFRLDPVQKTTHVFKDSIEFIQKKTQRN